MKSLDHQTSENQGHAADALRLSRLQLEMVVKGANVGIWSCPLPFDELIWDEKVKEHFHLPADARVTMDTFFQCLHPEDRERTRRAITNSIARKQPYDIDFRTVSSDGRQMKWVHASGRGFYDPSGNPIRFDGVTIDMTARKQAEHAHIKIAAELEQHARVVETVMSSITDFAYTFDREGRFVYANKSLLDLWGLKLDEAIGKNFFDLNYPPEPASKLQRQIQQVFETRVPLSDETHYTSSTGASGYYEYIFAPVISADGSVDFVAGSTRDITGRKTLLEAERFARSHAEHASQLKDEFLATISHELRTPLNAILGWSQILSSGHRSGEDLEEGLRTIERNARAQAQIIDDLLDMSRIISGKVRLELKRLHLPAIVEAAVATARPAAEAKGVRLLSTIDLPADLPIRGDGNRLQQVLWNLLSNAVKFTPCGGRVQLLARPLDSSIQISVIDTGQGIEPEFLPFVFDRFRQADASITRRHGGLGLGLSIAKQLIELHGGSVRAQSEGPGRGATFMVVLPRNLPQGKAGAPTDRQPPPAAPVTGRLLDSTVQLHGVRVLVVDDEPDARKLVQRVLEERHALVTLADSTDQAVRLLLVEKFDVLISDIGMPDQDGYALIKRVRSVCKPNRRIPAIALTAYARGEDRLKALAADFQMHLTKPIEPAKLLATIASAAATRTEAKNPTTAP